MYYILLMDRDEKTRENLEKRLKNLQTKYIFLTARCKEEARFYLINYPISLIVADVTKNTMELFHFMEQLSYFSKNPFVPVIYLSDKLDYIISAYHTINCIDYQTKPVTEKTFDRLINLMTMAFNFVKTVPLWDQAYLRMDSGQYLYKLPIEQILYIECSDRKCTVVSFDEVVQITCPMKRILESLKPNSPLIQSHRAFIINILNVKNIDRSDEPWTVHFQSSDKTALVGRSFKKNVLTNFNMNPL